ncbi:MAG: urea ABC transporter permease subunit UrtC [Gammaproteobacteria bacterium]|nr:urea ABC transporter permease subunit UrtC [Gammaproteobacteria bacterium]
MQQRSNIRFMSRQEVLGYIMLAVILLAIIPLSLDVFRLNLIGKYLTYAFVALGLVLCWGYGGILSLGQGVFFGLGGYCMAMFLKLEASDPESTKIQSTPGIPDFMDWNQITELPWWWEPFRQLPFALSAIVLLPTLFAFIIGVAMFKRRVGGVYFAIITQAIAAIMTILIIGQQGYTGGVNGITDLRTLLGWDIRSDSAKVILYYVCSAALFICLLLSQFIRYKKLGRILVAMRDREDRVRFSGYDVANFKIFVFCLSAMFSAIGGAMFTLQVGFMSPSFVGIVPSIEMVIYCAVGGRLSLLGAVYGTLLVNWAKTIFSETFPELWLFAMGALFIAVVMAFPNGLASLFKRYIEPKLPAWYSGKTMVSKAPIIEKDSSMETAHANALGSEENIGSSKSLAKPETAVTVAPRTDEKLEGGVYVD